MLDISTDFLSKVSPSENFITKPNLTEDMKNNTATYVHRSKAVLKFHCGGGGGGQREKDMRKEDTKK
jgi:hypothetical protein